MSTKQPLISVIVPVYNVDKYLRKCMDSLCGQSYQNLQIIAVDDGSTDESLNILREYEAKDPRVEVIHQENQGASAARNKGLDLSRGEWVTGCDPDDWLELNAVESVIAALSTTEADVAICGYRKVDEERNYAEKYTALKNVKQSGVYKITEQLLQCMFSCCYFWNKYIRRSLIEELSLRFERGRWYEDVSFSCIALLSRIGQNVVVLNSPLYNYRQHKESILGGMRLQKNEKAIDACDEAEKVLMYLYKKNDFVNNRHLAIQILQYYGSTARNNVPNYMLPEVERRVRQIMEQCGLNKWHLMYFYGIRSLPSIVKLLFLKIVDSKISVKLFGVPLLTLNRRNGMIRVALIGIPIYKSTPLPYKKLTTN